MSLLKSRAYKGLAWQAGSVSFTAVANIVYLVAMARLVQPESFGKFALVSVVIGITQIISQFGFGPALIQRQSLSRDAINFVFYSSAIVGVAVCTALVLLAPWISQQFDYKVEASMIQVLAISVLATTLGVTSKSLLIRELAFNKLFWSDTISYALGNVTLGIVLAMLGYEEWALLLGMVAASVMATVLYIANRPLRLGLRIAADEARHLFNYSVKLTAVQFLNQLAQQLDKLILGKLVPLAQLGVFERSQRIQNLPLTYAGNFIDGLLFSVMSQFPGNRRALGDFFFPFVVLVSVLTLYASVVTGFFAAQIVALLLGPDWQEAVKVLAWLAALIFIQTYARFGDTLVRATNEFQKSLVAKLAFVMAIPLCTFSGYSLGGFSGGVAGIVLAHLIHALFMSGVCLKITGHSVAQFLRYISPVGALACVLIGKAWVITHWTGVPFAAQVALFLLTDLVVLVVYLVHPVLLGRMNASFLHARMSETGFLPAYARYLQRRLIRTAA